MKTKRVFYVDGATTVCLIVDEGEVVARGLAIASRAEEDFDPALGRKYALDRANEAWGRQNDCAPIDIDAKRAEGVYVDKLRMQLAIDRFGYYKGYYRPQLTPSEFLVLELKYGNKKNNR